MDAPPPGAAHSTCPEAPWGVLALSRMVAVDKKDRKLKHISKPLKKQMKFLIDRTRWPVLITYSDEGLGHTGYVYKCSGWEKTKKTRTPFFCYQGKRVSSYSNGKKTKLPLVKGGYRFIQRWEHWICERGKAHNWMDLHGWKRIPIPGKFWKSGNQVYTYVKVIEENKK